VCITDLYKSILRSAYTAYENKLVREIKSHGPPRHIAVIMDGNRRFAARLGLSTAEGHERGKDKVNELLGWCIELGIKYFTVYAFSTENLHRSPEEVDDLMDLFTRGFMEAGDDKRIHENRIRIKTIGQRELLPEKVRDAIAYAEEKTKNYDDYTYSIAVAYGGREEIIHAIKCIAASVKEGKISEDDINEEMVSSMLYTCDIPDPDLILRTSGEERVSNFLIWQIAYAELYFTDIYWPGFRKIDFLRAIRSYQRRKRRFGE